MSKKVKIKFADHQHTYGGQIIEIDQKDLSMYYNDGKGTHGDFEIVDVERHIESSPTQIFSQSCAPEPRIITVK